MSLPIFLVFAIEFTLNNKLRTMIPKSFFMNHDPSINKVVGLESAFVIKYRVLLKQHRCKIRIIEARSGAPGNRTPLTTLLLLFIYNADCCLDYFWSYTGRN